MAPELVKEGVPGQRVQKFCHTSCQLVPRGSHVSAPSKPLGCCPGEKPRGLVPSLSAQWLLPATAGSMGPRNQAALASTARGPGGPWAAATTRAPGAWQAPSQRGMFGHGGESMGRVWRGSVAMLPPPGSPPGVFRVLGRCSEDTGHWLPLHCGVVAGQERSPSVQFPGTCEHAPGPQSRQRTGVSRVPSIREAEGVQPLSGGPAAQCGLRLAGGFKRPGLYSLEAALALAH